MEYKLLIKKYRVLRGMTQSDLAKKSKVKQSYISQLERGEYNHKSPTLRVLFRIAIALDICPHVLVQYDTNCKNNYYNCYNCYNFDELFFLIIK